MTEEPTQTRGDLTTAATGELAKALATFQKDNYAAEKTGFIKGWTKPNGQVGQPDRHFSNLEDILKAVKGAANHGLCHTETWHPIGTTHAILRVTLHHTSGETVKSELPVDITQEMRGGSKEQAQGSSMTYARRYLLMGIYGIVGADKNDSDDDGDSTRSEAPAAASRPVSKSVPPKETSSAPAPAPAKSGGVVFLTDEEKLECVTKMKGLAADKRDQLKADFKAEFKISSVKITPDHFQLPKHAAWVTANLGSYQ